MKKILDKRQMQTVMLLMAVIFILLCGVAYTVSDRASTPVSGNAGEVIRPPHEILRAARPSANTDIDWEINIGGSGNESATTVIRKNNELYIFGNTDSGDYDFVANEDGKTRGFGARLSLGGSTLAFTVFDFTIAKAIPTTAGFAIAGNEGSVAGLYTLSDSLTVTAKVSMPPLHALTACGLYVFDNRYFLIAESHDETADKTSLLLHIYTLGLSLEREKVFEHTYGLKLLDVLPTEDGYLLAASAVYQDLGYLTLARFGTVSAPAYTDFNLGYKYTPGAFMPLGAGYAAISDREGKTELLTIDRNLVKNKVIFLSETPNASEKTLFYAGAPYAFTGDKILHLGDDGKTLGEINFAATKITDFAFSGNAAFAVGVTQDGKTAFAFMGSDQSRTLTLETSGASNAVICATPTSLIAVSDTKEKSRDCGDFFGSRDVWVCRVDLQ